MATKSIKRAEYKIAPLSAVPNSRNSKTEKFSHIFLILRAPIFSSKRNGKFSVLGRKLLQSLRAESGAGRISKTFFKIFLGKKFELDRKSSSRRKIPISKASAPTLCAVPSWRFCFGESSSFELLLKIPLWRNSRFFAFSPMAKLPNLENKRKRQF